MENNKITTIYISGIKHNKRAVLGLSANFLNIIIKKSEKQIFYPERDFPSVKFFQLKILNKSEEKSKNPII